MRLVVKGLVCEGGFSLVSRKGSIEGYTNYISRYNGLKESFDIVKCIKTGEGYEIFKVLKVLEERIIKIIEDYPNKPNIGEGFGIDGVDYEVMGVICWEDGVVECVISKLLEENFVLFDSGNNVYDSLEGALRSRDIDVCDDCCDEHDRYSFLGRVESGFLRLREYLISIFKLK
jgi:hypothetical protein